MNDNIIKEYLKASQNLVNSAVDAARSAATEDFDGLAGVIRAGGLLKLVTTFAPLTRQALLQIVLCEPSGVEHILSQCELHREADHA